MAKAKYTEDGLHIITQKTINGYIEDFHNPIRSNAPPTDMGSIIRTENPALDRYLESLVKVELAHRGYDYVRGLIQGFSIMYNIFKRQASTNKLEEEMEN